jgi:hypothetical protein
MPGFITYYEADTANWYQEWAAFAITEYLMMWRSLGEFAGGGYRKPGML